MNVDILSKSYSLNTTDQKLLKDILDCLLSISIDVKKLTKLFREEEARLAESKEIGSYSCLDDRETGKTKGFGKIGKTQKTRKAK